MRGVLIRVLFAALATWVALPRDVVAAPSPKMLLELADLSNVAISPDGRYVAFRQENASVERNTYDSAWYVLALNDRGPPRRVADGGVPVRNEYVVSVEPPQWSANSDWIYYRALLDGQVQVWRAARDGSCSEAVTRDIADVDAFTLGADGRGLLYSIGASREDIQRAEDQEYDQGVLIDSTVAMGQGLYRSAYINGRLSTQRWSTGWMARQGLLADIPTHNRLLDLVTLQTRDATVADVSGSATMRGTASLKAFPNAERSVQSQDNGHIAFLVRTGFNFDLRMTTDANSSASVACAGESCRNAAIVALAWRPAHDQVVFTVADRKRGGAQSMYVWDLARGAVRPVIHTEGLVGGSRDGGTSCAIGTDAAMCVVADANTPPRLEHIELDTGARQILFGPNRELARAAGPKVELLRWTDSNGQAFNGQFYPPVLAQPGIAAPLFITYYVCPGYLRGGLGDEWALASLAGAGIAALCINHPPFDLSQQDSLAWYQEALFGIKGAIDLLQHRGIIDATRVGMGGLSFGSEVVMWTAMNSNLLAAASVTSPSVTPTYYWIHSLQRGTFHAQLKKGWGLGAPSETPERWRLISPAFQVDKIHTPLLLQMPEQEYLETLDYFVPLANSPTPTEMYVFPNESHQKVLPRHKLAAYERNIDWFRFWLQDYVDPDPRKADQYRRWREFANKGVSTR